MCFKAIQSISPSFYCVVGKLRSNRSKLRIPRLARRRRMCNDKAATSLVLRNLELYLENKSILEANEKLRQKAFLLQRHNTALTAEINKKFPGF